jgi:hypothetical protein
VATKNGPNELNQKKSVATAAKFSLTEEMATYDAHLSEWVDREGQFVLIKGGDVLGFFEHYENALEAGYERFGVGPFAIKQFLAVEPMYRLGRVEL